MKRKLLYDLSFSLKFLETCTSNYLPLILSQPLCIFGTGNILSSEKNVFFGTSWCLSKQQKDYSVDRSS